MTGKGRMRGNLISHSQRKTNCFFLPNLSETTFVSQALGSITLRVAQSSKRTVFNKYSSIDHYLLLNGRKLTPEALKLKKKIRDILIKTNPGLLEQIMSSKTYRKPRVVKN